MCVPFLTKILRSTLIYDDSSRRYTVCNLARAVTILNSTSKGQDNARELAYLLKNPVWRERGDVYEFGKILSIKDQTSPGSQVARYQTAICRLLCPN